MSPPEEPGHQSQALSPACFISLPEGDHRPTVWRTCQPTTRHVTLNLLPITTETNLLTLLCFLRRLYPGALEPARRAVLSERTRSRQLPLGGLSPQRTKFLRTCSCPPLRVPSTYRVPGALPAPPHNALRPAPRASSVGATWLIERRALAARRSAGRACPRAGFRRARRKRRGSRRPGAVYMSVAAGAGAGRCALALLPASRTPERAPPDPRTSSHGFSACEGRLPAESGQEDLLPAQPRATEAQVG